MLWKNVKLIFLREARDQLRDRRTLFTIAILPLLLYPLLGMAFLQISQFMRKHPNKVWIIGSDFLPEDPPLLLDDRFAADYASEKDWKLLKLTVDAVPPTDQTESVEELAQRKIRSGAYDAVVYFPPSFAVEYDRFRHEVKRADGQPVEQSIPAPQIFYNTADDKSRIALDRLERIINAWRRSIVKQSLASNQIPPEVTEPFRVESRDVAEEVSRQAAVWSKILPFVVLIWALTGAFYPAVDLCAGEKERGTLETLLSSPARRSEIVCGKLLTVMAFSIATSLLNLASMGLTGTFIIRQMERLSETGGLQIGAPPILAMFWLVLALIPISALFSALALAVAAFARSSKEGQYYLLPLLMITLPLIMIPMLPAAELDLGVSLIPVSGMMMLLRALIEGRYSEALVFLPPVAIVTGVCCLLAIRWAINQFQNESVLFRESERVGVVLWLRHVLRDRADTPSFTEALLCGVLLLVIRFFAGFVTSSPASWPALVGVMLLTQTLLIAAPAILMALALTRSPQRTLQLHWPGISSLLLGGLLALLFHPCILWLGQAISLLYPLSEETALQLKPVTMLMTSAPLWQVLLVFALTPAICEELAFRGFILSGLRRLGHPRTAIILSSLFFGLAHGVLQQSLSACLVGMVLGFVAIQTGSLLPAIAFHAVHNGLLLTAARVTSGDVVANPSLRWLYFLHEGEVLYHWPLAAIGGGLALLILLRMYRWSYVQNDEEKLQAAIDHQSHHPLAAKDPV